MTPPVLYSFRRCPYAMGARLALREAGVGCELREVLLKDKPRALLDASPKGTVPVLVLPGGRVIDESLAIIQWALQQSDPRGFLKPTAGTIEDMVQLMQRIEAEFKFHLDRYKYAVRYEGADETEQRQLASAFLLELEEHLQKQPFLFGSAQSMADITVAPFVRQFASTDRVWFDAEPWPKLIAWLNAFLESKEFLAVMEKQEPWHEGAPAVLL